MSVAKDPSHEYLKNAVLTATPEQLQLMLYDGAIRFATQGKEALAASDRENAFNAFDRAQRIVLELGNGINRDVNPELADQMLALYNFVFRRLVEANVEQDEQAADEALTIVRHMRETWVMLMDKLKRETASLARPIDARAGNTAPEEPVDAVEPGTFTAEG
jgi:flagellar protein FliS